MDFCERQSGMDGCLMYSHAICKSVSSSVVGFGVGAKEGCGDGLGKGGIVLGSGKGGSVGSGVGGGVGSGEGGIVGAGEQAWPLT